MIQRSSAAAARRLLARRARAPLPGGAAARAPPPRRGAASAAAAAGRRDELLRGVPPEHRDDVARVAELAERAVAAWDVAWTSRFYPPPVAADAARTVARMADAAAVAWGGHPGAERVRLGVGRAEAVAPLAAGGPPALAAARAVLPLRLRGNFAFDPADHRDFLGAVLGATGLDRGVVGDILVDGDRGALVFVRDANAAEALELGVTSVRSVPVTAARLEPGEGLGAVAGRPDRPVSSVEASARLDAAASAGFRLSRGKVADLVRAGDVRLNWRPAKASAEVKAGDVVSCAGRGRLEVVAVEPTARGRVRLEMLRRG